MINTDNHPRKSTIDPRKSVSNQRKSCIRNLRKSFFTKIFLFTLFLFIAGSFLAVPQAHATTLTLQVGASSDDTQRRLSPSYWNLSYLQIYAGSDDASNIKDGGGMRFTNVILPQGITITSAKLTFHSRSTLSGTTVNTRISAEGVDNAATFANDSAAFDTRWAARTTARVAWDAIGSWTAGTDYDSPDITTVIQEIVNRAGWASGNSMVIFWDDFDGRSSAATAYRLAYGYDESPTYAPKLVITYTALAPSISSPTQASITTTSATLGGNVTSDGGQTVTERGVCVGTSANPALGGTCFTASGTTGVFTANATSLNPNTLYHYRAYATNSVGTSYTTDDSFTTLANAPTITTPTKTPLHGSDATLGGNVTSDGGATVSDRGVCIGASSNPALGGTCFSTTGTTGVFTVSATSLTQGTLYHYRAYATNSVGTSYTTDDTFTTLALNNYLATIASPQTAGVCATGTNTVTARDSTNTTITTDSSTVNMTNSGTNVTFYTTSGCSSSTTQYTLSSGVANIYYKTNLAQSFTITATKNGSTETGTSSSITMNPGAQTRLVVTLPGQTFTATSGNSGSVTNQTVDSQFVITSITATDDFYNIVTGYTGSKILAYSGPTAKAGTLYTTAVNFTSGVSTTTLNTILTTAQTTTITVTDGGQYGYASSNLTVGGPPPPGIRIM